MGLTPEGAGDERAVLFLHGGGFFMGSIESHWRWVALIAKEVPCRTLMIDYRLAPEHRFPAALEDIIGAYRWMLARRHRPENIVIGGDSAGGGLAVSTMVSLSDAGEPQPAGAILLSPGIDRCPLLTYI